jgi:hypothetical protein
MADDHDCVDWNSGGACYICQKPIPVDVQLRATGEGARDAEQADEIAQLVQQTKMRNALLTVQAIQAEVRAAAERVMRLSEPGTPERLFTMMTVQQETGISGNAIVDAIQKIKRLKRLQKRKAHP